MWIATAQAAARRARRRLLLYMGIGLVVCGLAGGGVWWATRPAPAHVPNGPLLRYGIVQYSAPEKVKVALGPIASYLSQRLDRPVKLVLAADEKDLLEKFFNGDVDLAALSGHAYVQAVRRGSPGLVLLAKPVTPGGPSYQGLILTRADSGIRHLQDLRGKSFCYVNPGSTSGYLYPRALLRQAGLDPDRDLGAASFGQDHLNTLRLLDRGVCAAAAVYAKALDDGDKIGIPSERFYQLAATERIPYDAYCVLAKTSPQDIAAIQGALLALEPGSAPAREVFAHPAGEIIGFTRAVDSDYDSVRRIEQYLRDEGAPHRQKQPQPAQATAPQ